MRFLQLATAANLVVDQVVGISIPRDRLLTHDEPEEPPFDFDDATTLLAGPPKSCLGSDEGVPQSCLSWKAAIIRHNLVSNISALWAVESPWWYPHASSASLTTSKRRDTAYSNEPPPGYTEENLDAPVMAELYDDPGMDLVTGLWNDGFEGKPYYCPKCNNAKRIFCCSWLFGVMTLSCCLRQQVKCCKDLGCRCVCGSGQDCASKGFKWESDCYCGGKRTLPKKCQVMPTAPPQEDLCVNVADYD